MQPTHPEPLPVVLVGCGAVSQLFYLPSLRSLERAGEVRVAALVDPSLPARAKLAQSFPNAQTAATLSEISVAKGSLAIIATPAGFHAAHTLGAIGRGWNVLCEKPMAANPGECEQMVAAAETAGTILAVGHYKRFFPSSQYIKALCGPIAPLGRLCSFAIREGGPFQWPAASPSFFRKKETPGGVLLDIGVHVLDLLCWWLGDPSDFSYSDDAMGGLETNAALSFRFGSTTGEVHLSRDWSTVQAYEFEFEKGPVRWTVNDANRLTLRLADTPATVKCTLMANDAIAADNAQSFIAQLRNVVAATRGGSRVLVDGREGARAVRLIEACYARKRLLEQPWLTNSEAQNARVFAQSS